MTHLSQDNSNWFIRCINTKLFWTMMTKVFYDANQNQISMRSVIINVSHSDLMHHDMKTKITQCILLISDEWITNVHSEFDSAHNKILWR